MSREQIQATIPNRLKFGTNRAYKCLACGDTGWISFRQDVENYGKSILFANPCGKCKIQRRLTDITGILSEYSDADIDKFKFNLL